jgi:hypothetical protein
MKRPLDLSHNENIASEIRKELPKISPCTRIENEFSKVISPKKMLSGLLGVAMPRLLRSLMMGVCFFCMADLVAEEQTKESSNVNVNTAQTDEARTLRMEFIFELTDVKDFDELFKMEINDADRFAKVQQYKSPCESIIKGVTENKKNFKEANETMEKTVAEAMKRAQAVDEQLLSSDGKLTKETSTIEKIEKEDNDILEGEIEKLCNILISCVNYGRSMSKFQVSLLSPLNQGEKEALLQDLLIEELVCIKNAVNASNSTNDYAALLAILNNLIIIASNGKAPYAIRELRNMQKVADVFDILLKEIRAVSARVVDKNQGAAITETITNIGNLSGQFSKGNTVEKMSALGLLCNKYNEVAKSKVSGMANTLSADQIMVLFVEIAKIYANIWIRWMTAVSNAAAEVLYDKAYKLEDEVKSQVALKKPDSAPNSGERRAEATKVREEKKKNQEKNNMIMACFDLWAEIGEFVDTMIENSKNLEKKTSIDDITSQLKELLDSYPQKRLSWIQTYGKTITNLNKILPLVNSDTTGAGKNSKLAPEAVFGKIKEFFEKAKIASGIENFDQSVVASKQISDDIKEVVDTVVAEVEKTAKTNETTKTDKKKVDDNENSSSTSKITSSSDLSDTPIKTSSEVTVKNDNAMSTGSASTDTTLASTISASTDTTPTSTGSESTSSTSALITKESGNQLKKKDSEKKGIWKITFKEAATVLRNRIPYEKAHEASNKEEKI